MTLLRKHLVRLCCYRVDKTESTSIVDSRLHNSGNKRLNAQISDWPPSLSENGYFGFMLRQAFQKNPHILRVCSGFFEKLSLPKAKISHFRTGSPD
jgi:hypothetical protein